MANTGTTHHDLRTAIERTGYYPAIVGDAVELAVAGEPVQCSVVHQETTFDSQEVRRHVTVLVLTPTRLVVAHTDDSLGDGGTSGPSATTSTEAVRLTDIRSVVVSQTVASPARYEQGTLPREVVLTVGWGAVSRIDLEPASCSDPECDADHGFTGTSAADDLSLRVSAAAEGEGAVTDLLAFAGELSAATARVAR